MGNYRTFGCTIASGTALSDAVDLKGSVPFGIQMPAAWTAANLTFEVSDDGVTFADLYDASAEYALTSAAAGYAIGFPGSNVFTGWQYIKVRSGVTATPVNQGADRIVKILCKE